MGTAEALTWNFGPPRRDVVELPGLDDYVLAAGVEAFDDLAEVDFMAGTLVDPLVADPVRGAALELVEADRMAVGCGVQRDRQGPVD